MKYLILFFLALALPISLVQAAGPDSDGDKLEDWKEIKVYKTDPHNVDTDGDGFSDYAELKKGYSPLFPKLTLKQADFDKDGLSDSLEIRFKTDLTNPDSDEDGVKDGAEIKQATNPLSKKNEKLTKTIKINLAKQKLTYYLNGVSLGEFKISSGKPGMGTPRGEFKIINKSPKAWSPYGLWMPFWMGLGTGKFGLHELPVWPNGYREGEDHLGWPVSHGCIRLGVGSAKKLYDWAEVGVKVVIN